MKYLLLIVSLTIFISGCQSTDTTSTDAGGSAYRGMARIELLNDIKIETIDGNPFKPGLGKSKFSLAPGPHEAVVHLSSSDMGPNNVIYNLEGKPMYFKFAVEADKTYEFRCLKQRSKKIYTPYFVEKDDDRTILLTPMDSATKQLVFESLKTANRRKEVTDGTTGQPFDQNRISQPHSEH